MDRIDKALKNFLPKEKLLVKIILRDLKASHTHKLDIKKLKGNENVFRIRKGRVRIIYQKNDEGIVVIAISRRSEKTYRDF